MPLAYAEIESRRWCHEMTMFGRRAERAGEAARHDRYGARR